MMGLAQLAPYVWQPGWAAAWVVLAVLTVQRLGELVYAQKNTKALLARGAVEHGRSHYPVMVGIHASFLAALWLSTPAQAPMLWPLLIVFALLQIARLWVLATLGPYWTTRIISSPDFPRISGGPYRLVRHPNYWVVTLEILTIPLIFGHLEIAAVWTVLNFGILFVRIRAENAALIQRSGDKSVA
ncbi:isoprenylcysteine carboxylmethyltransferase family protein [Blastomonas sp.]|uniref:isoprenylcysteine carboxyl methyltransferase family protein n=1 Tax=Blastomonas sp. TaxID=1909299 RepID=UPI00261C1111|nr:isoprenylcysteine carboxylmethyltransferase family protein [Blastomonas sp.]MDM7955001.1 isoprenylcysteine carboxylmethyltransferase family protein [Blastomonas sp.]